MTNGSLMKVESLAECSRFCNTLTCIKRYPIGLENQFSLFLSVAVLARLVRSSIILTGGYLGDFILTFHMRFTFTSLEVSEMCWA